MAEDSESDSPEWVSDEEDDYVVSKPEAPVAATLRFTPASTTELTKDIASEQRRSAKEFNSIAHATYQAVAAITHGHGPHKSLQRQQEVQAANGSAAGAKQQYGASAGLPTDTGPFRRHMAPQIPPAGLPPPPVPNWHGLPPPPLPQRLPGSRPAAQRTSSALSPHSSQPQHTLAATELAAPLSTSIRPAPPGPPGRSSSSSGGGSSVPQGGDAGGAAVAGTAIRQPSSPAARQAIPQSLQVLHVPAATAGQTSEASKGSTPLPVPPGTVQQLQRGVTAEIIKQPSASQHLPPPPGALMPSPGAQQNAEDEQAAAIQHALQLQQGQQQKQRPAAADIPPVDHPTAHAATEQQRDGVQHSSMDGVAALTAPQVDQHQSKPGCTGLSTEPVGHHSTSEDEDGWLQVGHEQMRPPPVSRSQATAAAAAAAAATKHRPMLHPDPASAPAVEPAAMQPSLLTHTPAAQCQGAAEAAADGSAAAGAATAAAAVVLVTAKAPFLAASGPVPGDYTMADHSPFAGGDGDDFFDGVVSTIPSAQQQQQQLLAPQPAASSSNNAVPHQQTETVWQQWGPPPPATAVPTSSHQANSTSSSTGSTSTPLPAAAAGTAAAERTAARAQAPFVMQQQLQQPGAPQLGEDAAEGTDFWDTLGAGAAQEPMYSSHHPQQQHLPQLMPESQQQGQPQQAAAPTGTSTAIQMPAASNLESVSALTPEPFSPKARQQQQQQRCLIEPPVLPAAAPLQHDVSLGTWATAGAGAAAGASHLGAAAAELATEAQRALDMVPEEVDLAAAAAAAGHRQGKPTALPKPAAGGAASAQLQDAAAATSSFDAAHTADDWQQSHQQGTTQQQNQWHTMQQQQQQAQQASAEQQQAGEQQQQSAAAPFKVIAKPLFADDDDDDSVFFSSAAAATAAPDLASTAPVAAAVPCAAGAPPSVGAAVADAAEAPVAASPSVGYAVAAVPLFAAEGDSTAFFEDYSAEKPAAAAVHGLDQSGVAAGPAVTATDCQQQQQQSEAESQPWSHAGGKGADLFGSVTAGNESDAFFTQHDTQCDDVAASTSKKQQQQQAQPWSHSTAWPQPWQQQQQQQHEMQSQQHSQHHFAGPQHQQASAAHAVMGHQQQHVDDATAFFDDADDGSAFFAEHSQPFGGVAQPFLQATAHSAVVGQLVAGAADAASSHQGPPAAEAGGAAAVIPAVQAQQSHPLVSAAAPTAPEATTTAAPGAIRPPHTSGTEDATATAQSSAVCASTVPHQHQQVDDGSAFFTAAEQDQQVSMQHQSAAEPQPPSTGEAVMQQDPDVAVGQLQENSAAGSDQTVAALELAQQQQQQQMQQQQQPAVPDQQIADQQHQQQQQQQQYATEELWGQDDEQQYWHEEQQQQHPPQQDSQQQQAGLDTQWGQYQQQQPDWPGQQQPQPDLYAQQQQQQQQESHFELQYHQQDTAQQHQWTQQYQQYDQQGSSQQWSQQQQWNKSGQQQQQQQWGAYQPQQPWTPSSAAAAGVDSTPDHAVGLNLMAQQQAAAQSMMGMTRSRYSTRMSAGSGGAAGGYLPAPGGFMPAPAAAAAGMTQGGQAGTADSAAAGGGGSRGGVASYLPPPAAAMHPPEASTAVDLGMDGIAAAAAGTGSYGLPAQTYSTATSHAPQQQQQQQQPGWGNAAPYQPYNAGTSWQYNQHSHMAAQPQGYAAAPPSGYGQPAAAAAGYSQPVYDASALAMYAAAAPPMNMLEGRRSPHGRPPCCFVVFGVGGRAVLQQPSVHSDMDINFATMGAGVLHITTLAQLPAVLKMASPLNLSGTYPSLQQEQDAAAAINKKQGSAGGASIATSASTLSLTAVIKLLDSFPGPLNPSSSKDKCVKFIKDRLANCQLDELPTDAPAWQVDARKALWDLLLLLASNQGQLKSTSGSSAGSKAAAAVGNLLKGAVGAAAAAAGDGAASPSAAGIAAGKAAAGADVGSPRAAGGESELLRILAPGAAAGSAAGQRVLATAVPEVELQATAAEMQRLLLLGRREDALEVALAGQLWGPALLLAHGCGEKKFMEVSASMAQRGLIRGTPLRTLCLLLSNRPDLVHEASLAQTALNPNTTAGGAEQAPLLVPGTGGAPVSPSGVLSPGALGLPGVRTTNPGTFNPSVIPGPGAGLAAAGGSGGYTPGSGGYRGSTVGFFTPGVVGGGGGGDVLLSQWRENLAMMAANRTAADVEPIMQLGDRLLQEQQQVDAAHLCYVVAGCLPSTLDAGGRLTLLGVNQQSGAGRRALSQAMPLMRTEVYEWTRSLAGDAGQPWLAFLPYKLQLAAVLADFGQVARALHYCSVIDAAIRAVASKGGPASSGGIPPFLLVMTSQLEGLRERLSVHAAVHNIRVNSNESALAKVGRFFDKAITNLMWGSDAAAGPQPAVGRPLAATPAVAGPSVVDTVGLEYQPPPAAMGAQGSGFFPGSEQHRIGEASWMQLPAAAMSGPSSKGAVASPAAATGNSGWASAFRGTNTAAGYGVNSPGHVGAVPITSNDGYAAAPLAGSGVLAGGTWGNNSSTMQSAQVWSVSGGQSFTTGTGSFSAGPPSSTGTTSVTTGAPGVPVGGSTQVGLSGSSHMPGFTDPAGQGQGFVPDVLVPSGPASVPGFVRHHRTGSQLSNKSGTSAHGQLTVSQGNLDSAHHSRNPSYDVFTAAAAAGSEAGPAGRAGAPGTAVGLPAAAAAAAEVGPVEGAGSSKPGNDKKRSTGDVGGGRGGWLTGMVSSVLGVKGPPVAKLGLDNDFYYDEQRKRWVERGKEDASDDLLKPPPPPPTTFTPPAATTPAGSSSSLQHLAATATGGSGPPSTSGPPPPPPPASASGAAAGGPPSSGPYSGSVSSAAGPAGSGPPSGAGGMYTSPKPQGLTSSSSFLKRNNAGITSRYVAAGGINTSSTVGAAGSISSTGGAGMIPAAGRGLGGLAAAGPPSAGPPSGFLVPAAAAPDASGDDDGSGAAGHQTATAQAIEAPPATVTADSAASADGSYGLQQPVQQQGDGHSFQQHAQQQSSQQQQQQSGVPMSAPLVSAAAAAATSIHNRTPSASSTAAAPAATVSPVAAPVVTYHTYFPGQQQQHDGRAGIDPTGAAAATAVGHAGYGFSQQQHGFEQQYSQQQQGYEQQYTQQQHQQQQYPQQSYFQQQYQQHYYNHQQSSHQHVFGLQQQQQQQPYGVSYQDQHLQQMGFSSNVVHPQYGHAADGGGNTDAGQMHEVEL